MRIEILKGHDVSTQRSHGYDEIFVTNVKGMDEIFVTNVKGMEWCENKDNLPEYELFCHAPCGSNLIILKPIQESNEGTFYHASGNFGSATDSRFNETIRELVGYDFYGAVSIHDQMSGY